MNKIKRFKVYILLLLFPCYGTKIFSQSILGTAKSLVGKEVFLYNYNGFNKNNIQSVIVDQNGLFTLSFDSTNYGYAILSSETNDELELILDNEDIIIQTNEPGFYNTMDLLGGEESIRLHQFKSLFYNSDKLISAWMYLNNFYSKDDFWRDSVKSKWIENEILNIQSFENSILNDLKNTSFLNVYIPIFKLINSISYIINYSPNNIPSTLSIYSQINLSDDKVWRSGLYETLLESYFYLIENSNKDFEIVSVEIKNTIDIILNQLIENEDKFIETSNFLINLFNKKGYREENDYLMDAMLKQNSCMLNEELKNNLNRLKQLYIGEIAPNIEIEKFKHINNNLKSFTNLNSMKKDFKLIVFGSSKCHKCMEEIPLLEDFYSKNKSNDFIEIIFISLDDNFDNFSSFTQNLSFISLCSLQAWDTPASKDYFVQFTPSMFLLDNDLKIVLKPNSVSHLQNWINKHIK
jgi:thiol-disulfide isomerase/thioredoxin